MVAKKTRYFFAVTPLCVPSGRNTPMKHTKVSLATGAVPTGIIFWHSVITIISVWRFIWLVLLQIFNFIGWDLISFSVWTVLIYSWQPVLGSPFLVNLVIKLFFLDGCQRSEVLLPSGGMLLNALTDFLWTSLGSSLIYGKVLCCFPPLAGQRLL